MEYSKIYSNRLKNQLEVNQKNKNGYRENTEETIKKISTEISKNTNKNLSRAESFNSSIYSIFNYKESQDTNCDKNKTNLNIKESNYRSYAIDLDSVDKEEHSTQSLISKPLPSIGCRQVNTKGKNINKLNQGYHSYGVDLDNIDDSEKIKNDSNKINIMNKKPSMNKSDFIDLDSVDKQEHSTQSLISKTLPSIGCRQVNTKGKNINKLNQGYHSYGVDLDKIDGNNKMKNEIKINKKISGYQHKLQKLGHQIDKELNINSVKTETNVSYLNKIDTDSSGKSESKNLRNTLIASILTAIAGIIVAIPAIIQHANIQNEDFDKEADQAEALETNQIIGAEQKEYETADATRKAEIASHYTSTTIIDKEGESYSIPNFAANELTDAGKESIEDRVNKARTDAVNNARDRASEGFKILMGLGLSAVGIAGVAGLTAGASHLLRRKVPTEKSVGTSLPPVEAVTAKTQPALHALETVQPMKLLDSVKTS